MSLPDYTSTLYTDKPAMLVFNAINDIRSWWSEDFDGASEQEGDEFGVRFADMHDSRQKIVESIPGTKITWLVTDSHLSFLKNKNEWTGTTILFEIDATASQTTINFTHKGLLPAIECFSDCSKGWKYYLEKSLLKFINTGEGEPNKTRATVREI